MYSGLCPLIFIHSYLCFKGFLICTDMMRALWSVSLVEMFGCAHRFQVLPTAPTVILFISPFVSFVIMKN